MTPHLRGVLTEWEVGMKDPSRRHLQVRVVIEDEAGHVEERRFTAAGPTDELLVTLRDRYEAETTATDATATAQQGAIRTEERDGRTFTVVTMSPDPKLRPPTKRQTGRRIAEARLRAARNRNVPRRCRRRAR
jgi:hypothetical protein